MFHCGGEKMVSIIIVLAALAIGGLIIASGKVPVGKCPECNGYLYYSHTDINGLNIYVCKECGERFI